MNYEEASNRGVPQGAAISPILSMLVMEDWLKQDLPKVRKLAYADDSIAYSDHPFKCHKPPNTGIEISKKKKWVG
jgi:hypothetical protein